MALAGPGTDQASGGRPEPGHWSWQLRTAAAGCALSLAALGAAASEHHLLTWFDLSVSNHAGDLVRSAPQQLYSWQLPPRSGSRTRRSRRASLSRVPVLPDPGR